MVIIRIFEVMKTSKELSDLLKGYSLKDLAQIKLQEIAEAKKELELQEKEVMDFIGLKNSEDIGMVGVTKAPGTKRSRNKSSRAGRIRELTKINYMSVEEIAKQIDWESDDSLSFQKKKLKVRSDVKQMVRQGQMKSRFRDNGTKEYMTI